MKRIALALLVGCKAPVGDSGDAACGRVPPLSYNNYGEGFIGLYCVGCHSSLVPEARREGAPDGVNFDSYAGIVAYGNRIYARAVPDDSTMPPGGGPSSDERALLGEWLTCTVEPEQAQLGETK